ncbi:PREDICTED: putative odorant receptor 69a [Drosophila arizonae]|uniref:Odorant receptor n=1 Tax=Drosophila arizonae TaxID=7263 RepID=A0ABM1P0M1_DROAR|nr:PREDICTED: putative odorant receptor 69a [Drosophila arizonae]
MQLYDFMHYPSIGCRLAMMRRYEWNGSGMPRAHQSLLQRLWFQFGALNLIYQNVGMLIYLCLAEPPAEQLGAYVAQISETCSVMGLTLVGATNMWMLLHRRSDIESMLAELQQLYPVQGNQSRIYRIAHYYEKSTRPMRCTTIFFIFAFGYYNALPVLQLLYEWISESQHVSYKFQSNTWYPWLLVSDLHPSASFMTSYLCQALSSLVGVAFIMAGQFLLCFFITQMQLHFDALANALRLLDAARPGANEELKALLSYHSRLLHLANRINHIFNFTFLINFTTSTIAICMMGFAMVMINVASAFKYSVGLVAFLIFTLFICYNGTAFTSAGDKLLPAAFYNNWYEGDMHYRKMLLFFMMRSSESRVLRAYKFTPVSMATYTAILKFSYQLFTFVRAII